MAINTAPVVSGRIYLSDISQDVARLEGDCPDEEKAWVMVRQATEQDSIAMENRSAQSKVEWYDGVNEAGQTVRKAVERREDKLREQFAFQVYLCLTDVGNINDGSGPLFEFMDTGSYRKVKGGFGHFLEQFGKLPSSVAMAMRDAVYSCNPHWDWRATNLPKTKQGSSDT